jgi:hypothetical protein
MAAQTPDVRLFAPHRMTTAIFNVKLPAQERSATDGPGRFGAP